MELTIYAMGSAELMVKLLNAVASIYDTKGFYDLLKIGIMVYLFTSVLGTLLHYGGTRQDANVNYILGPWVIFPAIVMTFIAVGPRSTVVVEDIYSGSSVPVANVPTVLAAPFSFSTLIGMNMAETIETALQPVESAKLKNGGYVEGIKVLMAPEKFQATGELVKVRDSIASYFQDCVAVEIAQINPPPSFTREDLLSSPDLIQLIGNAAFTYIDTTTYIVSSQSTSANRATVNCSTAYDRLNQYMQSVKNNDTHPLNQTIGPLLTERTLKISPGFEEGISAINKVQEAHDAVFTTDSLSGLPGWDSGTYVAQQVIKDAMKLAARGQAIGEQNGAFALMIEQANRQQAERFAAHAGIFQEFAKPMLAFIESLIIFMTVLVPLMIAIGRFDFLIGWVVSMLWMSSWLPLLSLTNLYAYTMAASDLTVTASVFAQAGGPLGEFFMTMNGSEIMATKLAKYAQTANLMASGIPIISAAIMGGSLMGMGKLASGASAGGSLGNDVNAKLAARDAMSPAALIGQQAEGSAFGGTVSSNAPSSTNVGSSIERQVALANNQAYQKQAAMEASKENSEMLKAAFSSKEGISALLEAGGQAAKEGALTNNSTFQTAKARGLDFAKQAGLKGEDAQSFANKYASSVTAIAGLKNPSMKGGSSGPNPVAMAMSMLKAELNTKGENGYEGAAKVSEAKMNQITAQMKDGLTASASSGTTATLGDKETFATKIGGKLAKSDDKTLAKEAQEAVKANTKLSEASSQNEAIQKQFGSREQMKTGTMTETLKATNPAGLAQVASIQQAALAQIRSTMSPAEQKTFDDRVAQSVKDKSLANFGEAKAQGVFGRAQFLNSVMASDQYSPEQRAIAANAQSQAVGIATGSAGAGSPQISMDKLQDRAPQIDAAGGNVRAQADNIDRGAVNGARKLDLNSNPTGDGSVAAINGYVAGSGYGSDYTGPRSEDGVTDFRGQVPKELGTFNTGNADMRPNQMPVGYDSNGAGRDVITVGNQRLMAPEPGKSVYKDVAGVDQNGQAISSRVTISADRNGQLDINQVTQNADGTSQTSNYEVRDNAFKQVGKDGPMTFNSPDGTSVSSTDSPFTLGGKGIDDKPAQTTNDAVYEKYKDNVAAGADVVPALRGNQVVAEAASGLAEMQANKNDTPQANVSKGRSGLHAEKNQQAETPQNSEAQVDEPTRGRPSNSGPSGAAQAELAADEAADEAPASRARRRNGFGK